MITSRGILLGRTAKQLLTAAMTKIPASAVKPQPSRLGHSWSYRSIPTEHSKATKYTAEAVSAAMWWWVLWHLYHEYEHITGEFDYPNPADWTDAELGIPPDNYSE